MKSVFRYKRSVVDTGVTTTDGYSQPHFDKASRADPGPLETSNEAPATRVAGALWRVLIVVAFVLLTFPPCFGTMGGGLDASWMTGLNEASNRHLIFGRDIAFTYGPLGFIITPQVVGSNMIHAVLFRLGLHVLWWTSVAVLLARTRGYFASLLFAVAASLSGIHFGPTSDVNFQLTGVINLAVLGFLVLGHIDRRPAWGIVAAAISAAAILAKFNVGVAGTTAVMTWAAIQFWREPTRRMLARLGLVSVTYILVLVVLFRIYGGPIAALGDFFRYSNEIASGYSSQMSLHGPARESIAAFAILGLSIVAALVGLRRRARFTPVMLMIAFPMFVLFKGAVVRHDEAHFLLCCPVFAGLLAFLLPGRAGKWHSRIGQAIVAGAVVIACWFAPSNLQDVVTRGAKSWVGVCKFSETCSGIRAVETGVKDRLKLSPPFLARIGSASMDVYPWDLSIAIANGLNWQPRFVFQSYSAYTPILDARSAQNYVGPNAPRYIVYSYQAIDTEHPCIVDPRTLMEIFRSYEVVDQDRRMLLLERLPSPRWDWDKTEELGTASMTFGERWEVPGDVREPIVLKAKLKLSPLGRLVAMLYKVYPPSIQIEFRDGSTSRNRLVWQNIENGFIVSSLPRSLNGVRRFFETGQSDSVRAVSVRNGAWCFEKNWELSWSRVKLNQGVWPREAAGTVTWATLTSTNR